MAACLKDCEWDASAGMMQVDTSNADEWLQQGFRGHVSGLSCALPVVASPVASNIESFQKHAPDAQ